MTHAVNTQTVRQWATLHEVTFLTLGALLLFAAGAKAHQLCTEPISLLSLGLSLPLIWLEFHLGIWLVLGYRTLLTWRLTFAVFAVFACVAGYLTFIIDAESCGCFGGLRVPPWITLAGDVAGLGGLLLSRTRLQSIHRNKVLSRVKRIFPLATFVSVLVTVLIVRTQARIRGIDGTHIASGELVLLDPDAWIGKRLALIQHIDTSEDLTKGVWHVVLFSHDCHICHDVMLELESTLSEPCDTRIALVGIDATRDDDLLTRLRHLGCAVGSLMQDKKWFTTTPLRLWIEDGVCLKAEVIKEWE